MSPCLSTSNSSNAPARRRMPSARALISWSANTCKGWPAETFRSAAWPSSSASRAGATRGAGVSTGTRSMSARSFFDTNVLIYTDDRAAPAKQRRALELVAEHRRAGTGVVSLQVLQEYFVTVTRKLHVEAQVARRKVELLAEFDVAALGLPDILAAIDLHRLHKFSFWDALILRAAKQTGCTVLFSEDMQQAREVDGVRILNPFR